MAPPKLTILDCTLRDGGFYNRWDFADQLVSAYVDVMERSGVDVIELGYRAPSHNGYAGALAFTDDWYLERLPAVEHTRFAVMLDAKEFVGAEERVGELFGQKASSRVSVVRVATTRAHLDTAIGVVDRLGALGYATTINIMAVATLSSKQCEDAFRRLAASSVDVIYVADSFGSMYPEDIARVGTLLREATDKAWGVHLHNNLELAFSNALEAARGGATWLDSSVCGMGRGPGNLRTEVLLQHLVARCGASYDTAALYEFIGNHMLPLQEEFRWGPGPAYVLAGFLGVHPTYAQSLLATHRYSISEVTRILRAIHATGESARFDTKVLAEAISARHASPSSVRPPAPLDSLSPSTAPWSERRVLVVGRGGSASTHAAAINEFIARRQPIVIECNHSTAIRPAEHHFAAYAVAANARATALEALECGKRVIVPSDSFLVGHAREGVFVEDYRVREGALSVMEGERVVIPSDVVSMFAIALALRCGAREIDVVGFDGYAASTNERDLRMQSEMEQFLGLLPAAAPGLELTSLTPTSFSLRASSLYAALRDARAG